MNIDNELYAIRWNLSSKTDVIYITKKQVLALVSLMQQGLTDKSRQTRIDVLSLWAGEAMMTVAGVEITSTKNLTSPIASFLINLLLDSKQEDWSISEYGKELIKCSEARVKEYALSTAC